MRFNGTPGRPFLMFRIGLLATTLHPALTVVAQDSSWNITLGPYSGLTQLAALLDTYSQPLYRLKGSTLLAPNNDAINGFLNASNADAWLADSKEMERLLSYHLMQGYTSDFTDLGNHTWASSFTTPGHTLLNGTSFHGNDQFVVYDSSALYGIFHSGLAQSSRGQGVPQAVGNAGDGEVLIIDRCLRMPENISTTARVLDLTSALDSFDSFDLIAEFLDLPYLTAFLPTNAALTRAQPALSVLTTQELVSIFRYHAYVGLVYSGNWKNEQSFGTLEIAIPDTSNNYSATYVNGVPIVEMDVIITNGLIHVIDGVLNPNGTAYGTSSNALPQTSSGSSAKGSTRNVNVGAIAGGVIGGFVAIVLVLLLFWFYRRRSRRTHVTSGAGSLAKVGTSTGDMPELHDTAGASRRAPYDISKIVYEIDTRSTRVAAELPDGKAEGQCT